MSQLITAWIDRKIQADLDEGRPAHAGYVKELLPMLMGLETISCQMASSNLDEALYVYVGGYSTWMAVAFESFPEQANQNFNILQNLHWEKHGVWHGGDMKSFGACLTYNPKNVRLVQLDPYHQAIPAVLGTANFLEVETETPFEVHGKQVKIVRVPFYQVVSMPEVPEDMLAPQLDKYLAKIHSFMETMI